MALLLWRALSALALVAFGYVFSPTLITLHNRWSEVSHSYSHGYLLVAIAIFLIWQVRGQLAGRWRPSAWFALPLLLGATFFWFAGFATQLTLAQQVALPAILWLVAVVALGWAASLWLLLPALLLYFGIPVWDFLVEPLQRLTVLVTQVWLAWFEIPAYVRGFYIEVPTGSFEVAGGCSGLNYVLVASVIGLLHSYLNLSGWRRAAGVGLALALALLSNWIRVFALVLIGYYTRMESELIEDHDGFGWVIFACALVVYFLLSRWLLEKGSAKQHVAPPMRPFDWPLFTLRLWIACVVAIALPAWAQWYDARLAGQEKLGLPTPQVSGVRPVRPVWSPDYRGYDIEQGWALQVSGIPAELVTQTWHTQTHDRKLIYYANRLAPGRQLVAVLPSQRLGGLKVNRAVVRAGVSRRLVWWFYLVGDAPATGGLEAKIHQLPAWLSGDPRASMVALSIRCGSADCGSESDSAQLAEAVAAQLDSILTGWRASDS